ncbi:MAG: hypothetical protein WKG07_25985 [Hymenobacter sp.]
MGLFDFFKKDKESKEQQQARSTRACEKTKTNFFDQLSKAVVGKSTVDEAVLDDLESPARARRRGHRHHGEGH